MAAVHIVGCATKVASPFSTKHPEEPEEEPEVLPRHEPHELEPGYGWSKAAHPRRRPEAPSKPSLRAPPNKFGLPMDLGWVKPLDLPEQLPRGYTWEVSLRPKWAGLEKGQLTF